MKFCSFLPRCLKKDLKIEKKERQGNCGCKTFQLMKNSLISDFCFCSVAVIPCRERERVR